MTQTVGGQVQDRPPTESGDASPPAPTPTELAWAAGFFDGEGTTYGVLPPLSRRVGRRTARLRMNVPQKDTRPLPRFYEMAGRRGCIIPPTGELVSRWQANGKLAGEMLGQLWPYFSEPKIEQAIRAMRRCRDYNATILR